MIATQTQIAKECGVSQQTVSCILTRGKANLYSDDVREKVIQAAKRLGYRPNLAATAMAKGKFNSIGLITGEKYITSVLRLGLIWGIEDALMNAGMTLTLSRLPENSRNMMSRMPRILRCSAVDGYLVYYTHRVPPHVEKLFDSLELPTLWINNKRDYNAVFPDDLSAGEFIASKLLSAGHEKIAYLDAIGNYDYSNEHYSMKERFDGVKLAMKSIGLKPIKVLFNKPFDNMKIEKALYALLSQSDRPTAIVANYRPDFVLWQCQKLGLSVPQDVSIAAFLNEETGFPGGLKVDAMIIDDRKLGSESVRILHQIIENRDLKLEAKRIPLIFKQGNSIAIKNTKKLRGGKVI